jgi:hypothetical protein
MRRFFQGFALASAVALIIVAQFAGSNRPVEYSRAALEGGLRKALTADGAQVRRATCQQWEVMEKVDTWTCRVESHTGERSLFVAVVDRLKGCWHARNGRIPSAPWPAVTLGTFPAGDCSVAID